MGDLAWGWPRLEAVLLPVIGYLLYDIRSEQKRLAALITKHRQKDEGVSK